MQCPRFGGWLVVEHKCQIKNPLPATDRTLLQILLSTKCIDERRVLRSLKGRPQSNCSIPATGILRTAFGLLIPTDLDSQDSTMAGVGREAKVCREASSCLVKSTRSRTLSSKRFPVSLAKAKPRNGGQPGVYGSFQVCC